MSAAALDAKGRNAWICPRCRANYAAGDARCTADGWKLVQNLTGLEINKRYRLDRLIGVGGMDGTVWRAIQFPTEREVAVKLLPVSEASALQRFERGARLASKLNHPNITTIHDYGQTDDGRLYLAMELLEGRSLADHIKRSSLDIRATLHISLQLLMAVEHAHVKQIVHRDIKPANIFLVKKNEDAFFVKILDFGIARYVSDPTAEDSFGPGQPQAESITQVHQICGTPEYMAPEQITGGPPEPRTDIYALGVTMYRLLSGRLPFQSRDRHALYHMHLHQAPAPFPPELGVPEAIARVVMKALAKTPGERYADAAEMRQALTEAGRKSHDEGGMSFSGIFSTDVGAVKTIGTGLAIPERQGGTEPRRGRRVLIAVAAILLAAIGALGLTRITQDDTVPREARADSLASAEGGVVASPAGPSPSRPPEPTAPPLEAAGIEPTEPASVTPPSPVPAASDTVSPLPVATREDDAPEPNAVPTEQEVPETPPPVEPARTHGVLKVSGGPEGAEVWEGNRLLGVLPLATELTAGGHTLLVKAPGYRSASVSIETLPDSPAAAVIQLERVGGRAWRPSRPSGPAPTSDAAQPSVVAPAEETTAEVKPEPSRPRLLGVDNKPRLLGSDAAPDVRVLGQ